MLRRHGHLRRRGGIAEASGRDRCGNGCDELRRKLGCWWGNVVFPRLGGEETFGLVAVTLALAVLFVGVLNADFLVHQVLLVHAFDGTVR